MVRVTCEQTLTIQDTAFDPGLVTLDICQLDSTTAYRDEVDTVRAHHTWTNDNPAQAAVDQVTVLVGGDPAPMQLVEETDAVRQVGPASYSVVVGPGAEHTVAFDLQVAELPNGDDLSFGADHSTPTAA